MQVALYRTQWAFVQALDCGRCREVAAGLKWLLTEVTLYCIQHYKFTYHQTSQHTTFSNIQRSHLCLKVSTYLAMYLRTLCNAMLKRNYTSQILTDGLKSKNKSNVSTQMHMSSSGIRRSKKECFYRSSVT